MYSARAKECAAGRVLGPLSLDAFPGIQISRFGVIPKKVLGKWKLIIDLSSPENASVNDGIESSLCSSTYARVEEAVQWITSKAEAC